MTMKKMNRTALISILLVLTVISCNGGKATPTEAPHPYEYMPTREFSSVVTLPGDLETVESPSLFFIDFHDRYTGWAFADNDGGVILRTMDGGQTWLDVTPPDLPGVPDPNAITILGVNTAWVLFRGEDFYHGTLFHTIDGGGSWRSTEVPFAGADMTFLDEYTGWALADRGVGAGSNAVEIYRTDDGGITWTSVFHNDPTVPGSSDSLPLGGLKSGLTFLDLDTGWVTGSRPMNGDIYLFVTKDGGQTWAQQDISLPAGLADCQFTTSAVFFFGTEGYLPLLAYCLSGDPELGFFRSYDGGTTWLVDPIIADSGSLPPGQYSFADARHGFTWDGGAQIYFTWDGARAWSGNRTSLDLSDSLRMIDFVSGRIGWALAGSGDGGPSRLYVTADGGETWTQQLP